MNDEAIYFAVDLIYNGNSEEYVIKALEKKFKLKPWEVQEFLMDYLNPYLRKWKINYQK